MEAFKVVVEGRCLPGFDPVQVRAELAKLIRQPEDVAGKLLAGREVVVKSGVDLVTSTRYGDALRAIGVAARSMPDTWQLDDDFIGRPDAKSEALVAVRSGPRQRALGRPSPAGPPVADAPYPVPGGAAVAWPRFWARQIDFAACMIIAVVLAVAFGETRLFVFTNVFVGIFIGAVMLSLLAIAYETVMMTAFRTTVGKAIFGLRLEGPAGTRIEFARAVRRSFGVWLYGCGAYVAFPFATLIAWWHSYKELRNSGVVSWDDTNDTEVIGAPVSWWRLTLGATLGAAAFIFVFGLWLRGGVEQSIETDKVAKSATQRQLANAAPQLPNVVDQQSDPTIARPNAGVEIPVPAAAPTFEAAVAAYKSGDYLTALRLLRTLALRGDARAQALAGWMYETGKDVPQNYVEAMKWYRMAADQGDVNAQNSLGGMYHHGLGVRQDDAEAIRWYRKAAEQGDAAAQNNLGALYTDGRGRSPDYVEAAKWFRMAADQGFAVAQSQLGVMYAEGWGVPKDNSEAAKWFHKAADQGDAQAQYNLGAIYADGRGGTQDYVEAYKWYSLSATRYPASAEENRRASIKYRDTLAAKMTPEQIAEAQKLVREWKPQ